MQKIIDWDLSGNIEVVLMLHGTRHRGAFDSGPVDETKHTFVKYIFYLMVVMAPMLLHLKPMNMHVTHFTDVTDYNLDLSQLIATCLRHAVCSEAYCWKQKNG